MNDINKPNPTGGDILSYRPVVEVLKEIKTLYTEDPNELTELEQIGEPLVYHSKPVVSISESLPNSVISTLESSLVDIDSFIVTIEKKLFNSKGNGVGFADYKIAKINEDDDIVDIFMDYHFNDIKGDTNVEIYDNLQDLRREAIEFRNVFVKATYGKDQIDTEVAIDMDNVRLLKLYELESTEKFNKINYAALNSDIQINKVSLAFASMLRSCANNLYMLSMQSSYDDIDDSKGHISNTINKAFDGASTKSSQDRAKSTMATNTSLVSNSLASTFNSRAELLDALHTKHRLQDLPNVSNYIGAIDKAASDAENKLLSKVVDFNKSVLLSSLNKDDNINSLKEKSDLRNIFCSIK